MFIFLFTAHATSGSSAIRRATEIGRLESQDRISSYGAQSIAQNEGWSAAQRRAYEKARNTVWTEGNVPVAYATSSTFRNFGRSSSSLLTRRVRSSRVTRNR